MRTTKIKIKNLFGITEMELDGRSAEITGTNGVGKTSVIDSIRYALTNSSDRQYIVKSGENEGEILIETDTGLNISRKKRTESTDYKSVKENGREVQSPESFLKTLFTQFQLDPVRFISLPTKEQNRAILDLIDYKWDLNTIIGWFGELPSVNYEQNILQVLHDIQAEGGDYFQTRQNINREVRIRNNNINEIAKDLPDNFNANKWESFSLSEKYAELSKIKEYNSKIERAKVFKANCDNTLRGIDAKELIEKNEIEKAANEEKQRLLDEISSYKQKIGLCEQKMKTVDESIGDKICAVKNKYEAERAKLGNDAIVAEEWSAKNKLDTSLLQAEIETAEAMKRHLNEFYRMSKMQEEVKKLTTQSEELTRKIELARNIPGQILEKSNIPVENISIIDGIPLINGLPVSNLSEGEKLSLCVDIALSKPNGLQIILLDGTERLSEENRKALYKKCKEKGLQFIATRTTNDELEVTYL